LAILLEKETLEHTLSSEVAETAEDDINTGSPSVKYVYKYAEV
jgi:hypothetical protein